MEALILYDSSSQPTRSPAEQMGDRTAHQGLILGRSLSGTRPGSQRVLRRPERAAARRPGDVPGAPRDERSTFRKGDVEPAAGGGWLAHFLPGLLQKGGRPMRDDTTDFGPIPGLPRSGR